MSEGGRVNLKSFQPILQRVTTLMTTYLLPWMVKFTIQGSKYEVSKVRRDSKLVIIMRHLAANTHTFTQPKELPRTLVNPSKMGFIW